MYIGLSRDGQDRRLGSSAESVIGRDFGVSSQTEYPPKSTYNIRHDASNGSLGSASPNSVLI